MTDSERHPDGLFSGADDDCVLTPRLVSIAVGADMRSLAIAVGEPGNGRPDIVYTDRQKQTARVDHVALPELQSVAVVVDLLRRLDFIVDDSHTVLLCVLAPACAQLRRPDRVRAKEAVDAAGLPVARIA